MMQRQWWREGIVYQVYPRSFMDGNGDGIGDLPGLISRLDHLQWLGVTIVWINPVYRSPNHDNGYDVSDYLAIAPEFGTLDDWRALRDGLHARGMRLVMDLVVNHSSNEHPWFCESRKRDSAKRDWYLWRPPAGAGGPPNSWRAVFGGSAWHFDEASGEYYLGLFSRWQPDLNWRSPALREAVFAMMRQWLDLGVDGFRMDVINMIAKDPAWLDGDPEPGASPPGEAFMNRTDAHEWLVQMRREVFAGREVMTVGECPGAQPDDAVLFTSPERSELDMIFQFEHVGLDQMGSKWQTKPLDLLALKRSLGRWQTALDGRGWNSLYLMNHDQPRSVSRFGDDGIWREESAKLLLTLNLSLQGTPFLYQGEEIGMKNCPFASIDDYRDIESLAHAEEARASGESDAEILAALHRMSRDNSRTPMQWSAEPNAGFTTGTPWIALNPDWHGINVEAAREDPNSILHYLRRLIAVRQAHPGLIHGRYAPVDEENPRVFAYLREHETGSFLVALNFGEREAGFALPAGLAGALSPLIGNYPAPADPASLRPWEAAIWKLG
ncbi:glycoside hydrolase family 13 protein [Niveibacterium terrae]|uniref:glycoside hydrolase family 13 protein n=1 Tax=Niveibacterium terrae TaxID=3373598 RepID=UPI003A8EAC25